MKEVCGTAMGTPCACMYATIYYCYHEICVLLAKYERYLILYKRLIDDGCGIWNDRGDPGAWDRFCYDVNNFVGGKLKWVIDERCEEVNFLDITIRINELNRIETRTYQKPMNLYLYIKDNSAHPPAVMKGMIFGELLKQFDVPIVASMVSSQHLLKSDLLFDNNIHASEEYCLFMQLAAKYCFISVNEIVTKYRIHDNALTKKTVSRWADERRYTLDTIIKENPGIRKIYQKEFKEAYARADYYEARFLLFLDKKKAARGLLRKHIFQDIRYFLLYFMLYLPKKLQSYILHSKYNR